MVGNHLDCDFGESNLRSCSSTIRTACFRTFGEHLLGLTMGSPSQETESPASLCFAAHVTYLLDQLQLGTQSIIGE